MIHSKKVVILKNNHQLPFLNSSKATKQRQKNIFTQRGVYGLFVHQLQQQRSARLFNAWLGSQAAFYLCFSSHTWGILFYSQTLHRARVSESIIYELQFIAPVCTDHLAEMSFKRLRLLWCEADGVTESIFNWFSFPLIFCSLTV